MKKVFFTLNLLLSLLSTSGQHINFKATPHSHSHNDYLKTIPLWGALNNGCTSIEVDVFAHKNELKVAHIAFALNIRSNLSEMYLKPLANYLDKKNKIFSNDTIPLILMIDFKSDADSSLFLLQKAIEPYSKYFTYYKNDSVYKKALQLVISGKGFSYEQVKDLDSIPFFLDGSINSCNEEFPSKLVPRASGKYGNYFKWKGKGQIPKKELDQLRGYVQKAKSCGTKLRFYAMPENFNIWTTFLNEGVEWINVDNSELFQDFYWSTIAKTKE